MLPEKVERWVDVGLAVARRALWFPALVLTVHIVASLFFLAYDRFPPLDIPMHLIGGFAIAYFFHVSIRTLWMQRLIARPDRQATMRLLLTLVCASTVLWELVEYTSDQTLGTRSQAGMVDTLVDMLFGTVGGAAFVLYTQVAARAETVAAAEGGSPQGAVD